MGQEEENYRIEEQEERTGEECADSAHTLAMRFDADGSAIRRGEFQDTIKIGWWVTAMLFCVIVWGTLVLVLLMRGKPVEEPSAIRSPFADDVSVAAAAEAAAEAMAEAMASPYVQSPQIAEAELEELAGIVIDGKDGNNGKDGTNGNNGTDGTNGIK